MKLLFDLPERESKIAAERLKQDRIIYCTPFDLNSEGKLTDGWVAITATRALFMENGSVTHDINIREGTDYKSVSMVGNGILEAKINGEFMILARYTMKHVPRYAYIARILSDLSRDLPVTVKSTSDEGVCPNCNRILPQGTRVCPSCINKAAVARKLLSFIKPYRLVFVAAILMFWLITGLQMLVPYLNRIMIDDYLMPMKKDLKGFLLIIALITLCQLLITALVIIRGRLMTSLGGKLSMDLRATVYTKIQLLSLNFHNKRKTGDLMSRVTGDTDRIKNFFQNQMISTINYLFIFVGTCTLLFMSNWRLALLILVPIPVVATLHRLIWKKIRLMYHGQWKAWDKAYSVLQDILSGIRVVKSFGQEEKEIARFKNASRALADITKRNEKAWNTLFPALNFLMGAGQYLVMFYGSRLVLGRYMQLGELVQFVSYTQMLYGPLNLLTFIPRWFAEAMTSAERIFEIIDEEPDVRDHKNAVRHKIKGHVEFRNVTFGYQSHEPVLRDVNLDVKPGEMIGLVGHSGAGKSTLINLIMRLYDVDEGQILIDGIDIRDIAQQDLRSQIGVVLQETFLFSGTILENIRYSKPDATLEEVIVAAKIANAHDFIIKFPDGYDTKVGENGHTLSGGERQRIAIARAILHNPRILILDEATASLDTEVEQQIQEALGRLTKNRTTFAIAHRLSTLKNADRLVVIEKGKIAEVGSHDELLRKKGIYYRLVMAQRQMTKLKEAEGL